MTTQATIKKGDIFLGHNTFFMAICLEPGKEIQDWMIIWSDDGLPIERQSERIVLHEDERLK